MVRICAISLCTDLRRSVSIFRFCRGSSPSALALPLDVLGWGNPVQSPCGVAPGGQTGVAAGTGVFDGEDRKAERAVT